VGGKQRRLICRWKPRRGAEALAGCSHIGPLQAPIIGYAVSWSRPWNKMVTWDRRRSGSKPPLLVSRALRWLWRGSERRWNLLSLR